MTQDQRRPGNGESPPETGPHLGDWSPPGTNCGECGASTCLTFVFMVEAGERTLLDCPFYRDPAADRYSSAPRISGHPTAHGELAGRDILGRAWDFVLEPLPGEPSARMTVLPPRIGPGAGVIEVGDVLIGGAAGILCPLRHLLQVVRVDVDSGALEAWALGTSYVHDGDPKDLGSYRLLGAEGLVSCQRRFPAVGVRHIFLPSFCTRQLNHVGTVSFLTRERACLRVKLRGVRLLGSGYLDPSGPGEPSGEN